MYYFGCLNPKDMSKFKTNHSLYLWVSAVYSTQNHIIWYQ